MEGQKSILIIDHETGQYSELQKSFARCSHYCACAQDGLSALTSLKNHPFDLAILELELPDVEGSSLFSMLRRLYPDLPVLIVTRDDSSESLYKALHAGAVGYLFKPVDPIQVLFCVNEIFREIERVQRRKQLLSKKPARKTRPPRKLPLG